MSLYFMIIHALFGRKKRQNISTRQFQFHIIFSSVLIGLSTVDSVAEACWGARTWITSRHEVGGVLGFIATHPSTMVELANSYTQAIISDGFLVCTVLCHATQVLIALTALSPVCDICIKSTSDFTPASGLLGFYRCVFTELHDWIIMLLTRDSSSRGHSADNCRQF